MGNKNHNNKKGDQSKKREIKPKKILTLRDALRIKLNEDIVVEDDSGKKKKVPCLMAIADVLIKSCIESDGPTRRLFLRDDILSLIVKEQEFKDTPPPWMFDFMTE